jgi:hypothetical protein
MVEITNVKVYDLTESVIASRNAMRLTPPEYTEEEFEKAFPRAMKLAKCGGGSGHSNFRKGIRVSFDIKYPQYFTPELQRYGFLDIVTSSSKMHRLIKMDLDVACNKYVTRGMIHEMKAHVAYYNKINNDTDFKYAEFVLRDGERLCTTNKSEALYYAFMMCVSNCPMGLELFMRCSTNYEQLATIYRQRRHHKLKEDWVEGFCKNFIETLPYSRELILIGLKDETTED